MGTKTISISDDAYLRLARLKVPGESFSDVISRITGRGDLLRFAGSISPALAQDLAQASRDVRSRIEREARKRVD